MNRWMTVLVAMAARGTRHPRPGVRPDPTLRVPGAIELEEVLSIGSLSGEHDAFGRVTGIAVDSRGRILVADERATTTSSLRPFGRVPRHRGQRRGKDRASSVPQGASSSRPETPFSSWIPIGR